MLKIGQRVRITPEFWKKLIDWGHKPAVEEDYIFTIIDFINHGSQIAVKLNVAKSEYGDDIFPININTNRYNSGMEATDIPVFEIIEDEPEEEEDWDESEARLGELFL